MSGHQQSWLIHRARSWLVDGTWSPCPSYFPVFDLIGLFKEDTRHPNPNPNPYRNLLLCEDPHLQRDLILRLGLGVWGLSHTMGQCGTSLE